MRQALRRIHKAMANRIWSKANSRTRLNPIVSATIPPLERRAAKMIRELRRLATALNSLEFNFRDPAA